MTPQDLEPIRLIKREPQRQVRVVYEVWRGPFAQALRNTEDAMEPFALIPYARPEQNPAEEFTLWLLPWIDPAGLSKSRPLKRGNARNRTLNARYQHLPIAFDIERRTLASQADALGLDSRGQEDMQTLKRRRDYWRNELAAAGVLPWAAFAENDGKPPRNWREHPRFLAALGAWAESTPAYPEHLIADRPKLAYHRKAEPVDRFENYRRQTDDERRRDIEYRRKMADEVAESRQRRRRMLSDWYVLQQVRRVPDDKLRAALTLAESLDPEQIEALIRAADGTSAD